MIPLHPAQLASIDQADALCRQEPLQAAILAELRVVEEWATKDGIDPDRPRPNVFQLVVNDNTGEVDTQRLDILTRTLRHFMPMFQHDTAVVLDVVAGAALDLLPGTPPMPSVVRASFQNALHEYKLADGWRVHGLGITTEVLSARADTYMAEHLLSAESVADVVNDPRLVPAWMAYVLCCDSRTWAVVRQQGYELVYETGGPDDGGMDSPHLDALTRLLHAITETD